MSENVANGSSYKGVVAEKMFLKAETEDRPPPHNYYTSLPRSDHKMCIWNKHASAFYYENYGKSVHDV